MTRRKFVSQRKSDNLAKALVSTTAAEDPFDEVQWRVAVLQTQALVKAN